MTTESSPRIHIRKCHLCDEQASGPDLADVQASMERHAAKKHPKPKTVKK